MPSFIDRFDRPRLVRVLWTAVLVVAVLGSMPSALHPPPPPIHPGFTASFAWMAYALAPWSSLLPFALLSRRAGSLVVAAVLLGLAAWLRSTPIAALGASCAIGPLLADLDRDAASSTLLAIGVLALGGLIGHDLAAQASRTLAKACWAVAAAAALAAVFRAPRIPIGRGTLVAAVAVGASLVVRVTHR